MEKNMKEMENLFDEALNDAGTWRYISVSQDVKYYVYQGGGYVFEIVDFTNHDIAYVTLVKDGVFKMTVSDEKIKESLKDVAKLEEDDNQLNKPDYLHMCTVVNDIFDGNATGWTLKDKKEWVVGCDYYDGSIAYNIIQNKESNTMISFIKNNVFYAIKEDFIIGVLAIKVLDRILSEIKLSFVLTDEFGNAIFNYMPDYCMSINESNYWKTVEGYKNKIAFEIKNVVFTITRHAVSKKYNYDMVVSYDDKPIINSKVTDSNVNSAYVYSKTINLIDILITNDEKVVWHIGKCYNGENIVIYYECHDAKDQDYLIIRINYESVANLSTFEFDRKYYVKMYQRHKGSDRVTLPEEVIKPYLEKLKDKATL